MGDLQLNFFLNLSGHLVTRPLNLQFNSIFCFAPPPFSEEIPWIHSARLDEALVTPAILLGCASLEKRLKSHRKSAGNDVIGESVARPLAEPAPWSAGGGHCW